jgi:hypothetical protein
MGWDKKDIIECQRFLDHTHDFFPFGQTRIIQSSTSPCKPHFRRKKVTRPVLPIALIFALAFAPPVSAQIYQWKDKDGRTHFSDRPPPEQQGIQMKAPKRAQPMADPARPDEAETTENAERGAQPAATATPAPVKGSSPSEQRDEEFRKRRAAAAEAREKAEKDAARLEQREQNCQRARAQHAALSSGQRIAQPTEDGGRKFLNDEERAAEIARTEEMIQAFCDKN